MVWNESANVCGEKSEGTEAGAAPKIEAGPQTLSTAASNQPLTRSDCDKAGMAWNERGNVCGAKTSSVKPPPLPVRKPPEPTQVTSVKPPTLPLRKPQLALTDDTASQPLTRAGCDKANMVWNERANVCGEKSEGTEAEAAPKIEAGPPALSTAASNQPLTRSDCDKAGMAWNERGNVCGAKTSSVKPPPLPVRKSPEPTKVTSVTLPLRKPQQVPGVVGPKD